MADQEQAQEQRNTVHIVLKCQYALSEQTSFGFDLEADCLIEHIPGIVKKLMSEGVKPAQTPYTWSGQQAAQHPPQGAPAPTPFPAQGSQHTSGQPAPLCPVHGTMMAISKFGGWYCKAKVGMGPDGNAVYCQEKVAG